MKRLLQSVALVGSAVILACSDGTGPATGAPRFSREITLPEFDETLAQGPARLEIELLPGGLVAREIEIKQPAELVDEEEIESRITAIEETGAGGSVTLALGDLMVGFTEATRFRTENGGGDLTRTEFVDRVQAALATGEHPAVEARRAPLATLQDPADQTFMANDLRLDDEADEPEIEINVTDANRVECSDLAAAPPEGCIAAVRVLGLGIAIVQGVTELESEMADLGDKRDFEGLVASVDVAAGSVTLQNGTVIRVVLGTELETQTGDDDQLRSLAEVEAALAAGLFVEADGKGVVESVTPLTIVAIEIEFEVEDEAPDIPGALEFKGPVRAVDAPAGTFTLAGGTVVRVTTETMIEPDGDLLTLEAVAAALAAARPVRSEGDAVPDASGVLRAIMVKWEVDHGGPGE